MTHDYEFHVHNLRTLAEIGEIDPRAVWGKWTRSAVRAGSFEISVPRDYVTLDLIGDHHLLEINREGQVEFVGVIERRTIESTGRVWKLAGPDLKGFWFKLRQVGAYDAEDRSGVAETVLLDYVNAHLGPSAAAGRRAADILQGITWTMPSSSFRGGTVDIRARRRYLHDVVTEIAEQADLLPEVTVNPDYSGYTVEISEPHNATSDSGGVPFGVDWDNTESLVFVEDYSEHKNYLYIAGDGTGDSRNITEVYDEASVASHFRREHTIDARDLSTSNLRQMLGELELLKRNRALVSVQAVPLRGAANSVYREDWDVGWDVTFLEQELRADPIDVRVVAATVELSRAQGERITFELGQQRATSQLRRIEQALRELRVASLE